MLVKPSLVLEVSLQPEESSSELAKEIARSYMHIAQSIVRELPADKCEEGNLMKLRIRIMHPYWDPTDAASAELWEKSVHQWLVNTTRNLSTAMHNFNEVEHPVGAANVCYEWADYVFESNMTFRVKVGADNRIPLETVDDIELARTELAAQHFGSEEIVQIRIPSAASLDKQLSMALESERIKAADNADAAGEDAVVDDETIVQQARRVALDNLDRRIWGIEYADGSVIEYDTESN